MPSREVLETFVAAVESGDHAGAIQRFYTEDASMQENLNPPRQGRDLLDANEQKVLDRADAVCTTCASPVLVDADSVVIHWIVESELTAGSNRRNTEGEERGG